MESHIKKEVTKQELKEILMQINDGALISIITSIKLSYRAVQREYLVDAIIAFTEISKEKLERELKNNLKLNIKIID